MGVIVHPELTKLLLTPELTRPGVKPIGDVKTKQSHPLISGAKLLALLDGSDEINGDSYGVMTATSNLSFYCPSNKSIDYPNVEIDKTEPYVVCWSEYVTAGAAVLNRGPWRVKTATDAVYAIYGGSNPSYNQITIRATEVTSTGNYWKFERDTGDTPDQEVINFCFVWRSSTDAVLYGNGVKWTGSTSAALSATTNTTSIGRGFDFFRGYLGHYYVSQVNIPNVLAESLSVDPYQIWESKGTIAIPIPAVVGGVANPWYYYANH